MGGCGGCRVQGTGPMGGCDASARPTTSGFCQLWLPRIQTPPESRVDLPVQSPESRVQTHPESRVDLPVQSPESRVQTHPESRVQSRPSHPESTCPSELPKCPKVSPTHSPAVRSPAPNSLPALSPTLSTPTPTQAIINNQPSPKPAPTPSGSAAFCHLVNLAALTSELGAVVGVMAGRMDGQIATDARAGLLVAGQPTMAQGSRRRSQRRKLPTRAALPPGGLSRAARAAHATSMPWVVVEPSLSSGRAPGQQHGQQREQSKLRQIAHARQLRRVRGSTRPPPTCMPTCTHAYMHASRVHACIQICAHTHTHTYTHTYLRCGSARPPAWSTPSFGCRPACGDG